MTAIGSATLKSWISQIKSFGFNSALIDLKDRPGSLLRSYFFSEFNVDNLQNSMRFQVYKATGKKIGLQDRDQLVMFMVNVFRMYPFSLMSGLPDMNEAMMSVDEIQQYLKMHISAMNKMILDQAVPQLCTDINFNAQYLDEAYNGAQVSALPMPIATSVTGQKTVSTEPF